MNSKRRTIVILVIALIVSSVMPLMLIPLTAAQDTTVAIGDASAALSEEVTVSIMINNVPVDIMTADVTLTYNKSVVHVISVSNSQFDNCIPTIDNVTGSTRIGAYQTGNPALTGDVKLCNVTLRAVGNVSDSSPLNITITRLEARDESVIVATPDNGTLTIHEITPPSVTNPNATLVVIPDDTDNKPLWSENSTLNVTVTDASGILSVTINLSQIGGSSVQPMTNIGGDIWSVTINASNGTAGWNGTAYVPYCLQVNATDIYDISNTSVCINLTVMKNGDVSGNGVVTLYDASYIAKWYLDKTGFETIIQGVADVSGNGVVTLYDASYTAKWYLDKTGFEVLK